MADGARTADEVWNLCNRKLQSPRYSVRGLIAMSNVETICTTDDPIDTLLQRLDGIVRMKHALE